ncbi:MAG: nucleotidyltransferase family protein [Bacillota bacterium]
MDQAIAITLEAVKATLNNTKIHLPRHAQDAVFKISKENGFSGMLFTALNQEDLDPSIYAAFKKEFYLYHTQDIHQLDTITQLKSILNQHNIPHILLKGSHLKTMYPATYMRGMGDIDILIKKDAMNAVHRCLKKEGFTLTHQSAQHDIFESPNKVPVEVHPKLYKPIDKKYAPLFQDVWRYAKVQKKSTYLFDPHFELAYLLYHIVKHFHGTGIGLRTVLDIGIFLDNKKHDISLDTLTELLKSSSLYTFFINTLYLNYRYFDINPYPSLIDSPPIDEATFEQLTAYITTSGIHGTGTSFNNFISRLGASNMHKKGKLAFTLRLMFPSYQTMKGLYPWLKYMPLLYPFTWLIRLGNKALFQRRKMAYRYKQLRVDKDIIEDTSTLYKSIGL